MMYPDSELTREERVYLREEISRTLRAILGLDRPPIQNDGYCGGCGAELDSWTAGCRTCRNRHRKRMIDYSSKPDPEGFAKLSAEKQQVGISIGVTFH